MVPAGLDRRLKHESYLFEQLRRFQGVDVEDAADAGKTVKFSDKSAAQRVARALISGTSTIRTPLSGGSLTARLSARTIWARVIRLNRSALGRAAGSRRAKR